MTVHARVVPGHAHFGVTIHVYDQWSDDAAPVRLLRIGEDCRKSWEQISPGALVQPTFELDDNEARALLDGLLRYYSGGEDTRMLRKDYDDERKRVDKLAEHLAVIARQATAPPSPMFPPIHPVT